MNVKRWLAGSFLLALLGGCVVAPEGYRYNDGYSYRYYSDGGSRRDGYRYNNNGWRRDSDWDRGYERNRGFEYRGGGGYQYRDQH